MPTVQGLQAESTNKKESASFLRQPKTLTVIFLPVLQKSKEQVTTPLLEVLPEASPAQRSR